MKDCTNILFDLDGTLIDSYPGIRGSLEEAFAIHGVAYSGDFWEFIGPPLQTSFPQYLGLSAEMTSKVYLTQRELYDVKYIFDFTPFPGAEELLEALHGAGKNVCLVTSKLETQASRMLESKGLLRYFSALYGQQGERMHKLDVLRHALDSGKLDPAKSVMIGDRHFDLNAANELGVRCVGAGYGYAPVGELAQCRPGAIVENIGELKNLLL